MKRYNTTYQVDVIFEKSNIKKQTLKIDAPYIGGNKRKDTFIFFADKFSIVMTRNKVYNDDEILRNDSNSVCQQLLKALLFYFSQQNSFKIESLKIYKRTSKKEVILIDYTTLELLQPLNGVISSMVKFNSKKVEILLEEDPKSFAIRNALSYWQKGMSSTDKFYRFERLWRAFDRLCLYNENTTSEHTALCGMRKFILNNTSLFSQTISLVSVYDKDKLRDFRWRKLILNEYHSKKKTKDFYDFVLRYSDYRIMDMFKELLPYREQFLNELGLYSDILNHINKHLIKHTENNCEIVTLLGIKYTYFVRNQMFHGEIPDSTLKLFPTKEDREISELNSLLECLVGELINGHTYLR